MRSNKPWNGVAAPCKARIHLLGLALGLGVLAFAGPAAAAKTITVATTVDTAPGTTTGSCSLRMAIERANANTNINSCTVSGSAGAYVINVPANATAYAITGSNGPFHIRRSMTIQGVTQDYTSTTVKGNPSYGGGVFVVDYGLPSSVTVNLKYMRITNSQDLSFEGGALNVREPTSGTTYTVNVDTVQIDNCISWTGGAIRNGGGNLTVSNSYIHDNKAASGGAIASSKANNAGSLTVTRSKLSNNRADQNGGSGYGGAIYISSTGLIKETTIDSNIAVTTLYGGDGGGIYVYGNGGVDVDFSTISNNVGRSGGGMYQAHPSSLRTHNSTISNNSASIDGGGIYGANYLEMFSTTVAKNRAYSGTGGGVYYGSASGARTNACIIADNTKGTSTLTPQDYKGAPHGNSADARSFFGVSTETTGLFVGGTNFDLVGSATVKANLGPLANNTGYTWTHAIGTNSAAYNAEVSNNNEQATDQRGITRPQASVRDLGAFEYKP